MHKQKKKKTKQNKTKQNKTKQNKKEGEIKSDKITLSLFPSTSWKNLSVEQTFDLAVKGKN